MKLEQSFTVAAPIEVVWDALIDVERVAPCLPGAEITGHGPDESYEGNFTVKLGPTTASYRGSLKMDSLDEASRTATMHARGTDKRGQGGAQATIVSTLREEGGETVVDVITDFTITGRLARFGRGGMIEDISKRMMRDFSQCLQATLTSEPEPAAAAGAPAAAAPVAPGEMGAVAAGASDAAAAGAGSVASDACRHCEKSRIIRLEMSSIIPPRPKRASRPVIVKSVTTSTTVSPLSSRRVETIDALAPPWPRLSVPLACMVAVCDALSSASIFSEPRYDAVVGPSFTVKFPS